MGGTVPTGSAPGGFLAQPAAHAGEPQVAPQDGPPAIGTSLSNGYEPDAPAARAQHQLRFPAASQVHATTDPPKPPAPSDLAQAIATAQAGCPVSPRGREHESRVPAGGERRRHTASATHAVTQGAPPAGRSRARATQHACHVVAEVDPADASGAHPQTTRQAR